MTEPSFLYGSQFYYSFGVFLKYLNSINDCFYRASGSCLNYIFTLFLRSLGSVMLLLAPGDKLIIPMVSSSPLFPICPFFLKFQVIGKKIRCRLVGFIKLSACLYLYTVLSLRLRATLVRISQGLEDQRSKNGVGTSNQQTPQTSGIQLSQDFGQLNSIQGAANTFLSAVNMHGLKVCASDC